MSDFDNNYYDGYRPMMGNSPEPPTPGGCLAQFFAAIIIFIVLAIISALTSCGVRKTAETTNVSVQKAEKVDSVVTTRKAEYNDRVYGLVVSTDTWGDEEIEETFYSAPDSSGNQYIISTKKAHRKNGSKQLVNESDSASSVTLQTDSTSFDKTSNSDYTLATTKKTETDTVPWYKGIMICFFAALCTWLFFFVAGKILRKKMAKHVDDI